MKKAPDFAVPIDSPMYWQQLTEEFDEFWQKCQACQTCELSISRKNVVGWRGASAAPIMILGEAPGANEDELGVPFVGRSGQLLQKALDEVGIDSTQIHITNIVKCRPPLNRVPTAVEVTKCSHLLQEQIELVAPQVIICLGQTAYTSFTGDKTPVSQVRGKFSSAGDIKVLATFHPAYILRCRGKYEMWLADLDLVKQMIAGQNTLGRVNNGVDHE